MEILSSCELIAFEPEAHEAGSSPQEKKTRVKVIEKSVGMNETYQAKGLGLNPEIRLLIPYDRDYHGESILEYKGERWKLIRPASNEYNGVMLTIQRISGNAAELPEDDSGNAAQNSGNDAEMTDEDSEEAQEA